MQVTGTVEFIIYCITFAGILAASYTDWKYHKIPVYIFPPVFLAALAGRAACGTGLMESFAGFGTVFAASVLGSLGGMGGGDIIMLSTVAFVAGSRMVVPFFLIMTALILLYAAYARCIQKKKGMLRIPLAPFCILPYLYVFISFLAS